MFNGTMLIIPASNWLPELCVYYCDDTYFGYAIDSNGRSEVFNLATGFVSHNYAF
jgi:hypothetical protein